MKTNFTYENIYANSDFGLKTKKTSSFNYKLEFNLEILNVVKISHNFTNI